MKNTEHRKRTFKWFFIGKGGSRIKTAIKQVAKSIAFKLYYKQSKWIFFKDSIIGYFGKIRRSLWVPLKARTRLTIRRLKIGRLKDKL